ncbi:recombinase family protein [Cryobacterium sp. GrIS_2_6]|uniref:recombinase family protein n=1 Tax=Cryobacterium sp. GrIS_2_6 TaxID=3162785 RepID=UPI002E07F010|nr:DNA invertase Pin-like site-specific DNA recombinase [Cryobacterium psychrotolerans]
MSIIGYARVSTEDQNLDGQLLALNGAGAEKIFQDHGVSGTKTTRPGLDAALAYLRDGDVLLVHRLDRLGRSTLHVLALIQELGGKGVGFRSLTESVDTTTPAGRLLLTLLAGLASMEREVTVERTRAGLAAARARGRIGGRPRALTAAQIELAKIMYARGTAVSAIAAELGCGRSTAYRALEAA